MFAFCTMLRIKDFFDLASLHFSDFWCLTRGRVSGISNCAFQSLDLFGQHEGKMSDQAGV